MENRENLSIYVDAVCDGETRVATCTESDELVAFDQENTSRKCLKGSIFLCKVTRIEKSLEAAFVDYGREKNGFLPFSEILFQYYNIPDEKKDLIAGNPELARKYKIQNVIYKNQLILAQVTKDERGNKGVSLSTNISFIGCFLILTPYNSQINISRSLQDNPSKEQIKDAMRQIIKSSNANEGVIIKSSIVHASAKKIRQDYDFLRSIWQKVSSLANRNITASLVYTEEDIVERIVRGSCYGHIKVILIDGIQKYKHIKNWLSNRPQVTVDVKPYTRNIPIYSYYKIEDQISSLYKNKLTLISGGYVVINITEALVAIDVNSGKMNKENDLEETAYKTNIDAAYEISKQLELRNLSGLIIIDFIDMNKCKHRALVEEAMEIACKRYNARFHLGTISKFGIMQISRQRTKNSVIELNTSICDHCNGEGRLLSLEAACNNIIRCLYRCTSYKNINVHSADKTILYLVNYKKNILLEIERNISSKINLCIDSNISYDSFRISYPEISTSSHQLKTILKGYSWMDLWIKHVIYE